MLTDSNRNQPARIIKGDQAKEGLPAGVSKETVIIVHGTFSGPPDTPIDRWYAPNSRFCIELNRSLASRRSSAKCWAHLGEPSKFFSYDTKDRPQFRHWDGENSWSSRDSAARSLRSNVYDLIRNGWAVHLIGHSHGGNIILDAITEGRDSVPSWFKGKILLLGTPILYRVQAHNSSWAEMPLFIAWVAALLLSATQIDFLTLNNNALIHIPVFVCLTFVVVAVSGFALVKTLLPRLSDFFGSLLERAFTTLKRRYPSAANWIVGLSIYVAVELRLALGTSGNAHRLPQVLALSSASDEAFKFLEAVQKSDNPLLQAARYQPSPIGGSRPPGVGSRIARYFGRTFREAIRRAIVSVGGLAGRETSEWKVALVILFVALLASSAPYLAARTDFKTDTGLPALAWAAAMAWLSIMWAWQRTAFMLALRFPIIVLHSLINFVFLTVAGAAAAAASRAARSFAWRTLQKYAFGFLGAPLRVNDFQVRRKPTRGDWLCIDLPQHIINNVQASQHPHAAAILNRLYTANHWIGMKEFGLGGARLWDGPLVHSAYYEAEECIHLAAAWISEKAYSLPTGPTRVNKPAVFREIQRNADDGTISGIEIREESLEDIYATEAERLRRRWQKIADGWSKGKNMSTLLT